MKTRSTYLLAGVVALAACGPAAAPSKAPPASDPSGSVAPGTTEFAISFTTPGFSAVPLLAAIGELNERGYEIDTPTLEASELTVQGVIDGQFAFSTGTVSGVLVAVQQHDAHLTMLSDRVSNEWTLYATPDIESCADLEGRRTGIGSEGAVSTAMLRAWVESECPGTSPDYLVLGQSPSRYAAMLAGEIDANLFELSDAIRIEDEAPDRFHRLASFAESLPQLHPTVLYGNGDFIAENEAVVGDLLTMQLTVHRRIAQDPTYLRDLVVEYLPDLEDDVLDRVAEQYVELGMFPVDGGLTADDLEFTIDFFTDAVDDLEPGLTVADVADLSYLDRAVAELGSG